jgi:hypothetical protein
MGENGMLEEGGSLDMPLMFSAEIPIWLIDLCRKSFPH